MGTINHKASRWQVLLLRASGGGIGAILGALFMLSGCATPDGAVANDMSAKGRSAEMMTFMARAVARTKEDETAPSYEKRAIRLYEFRDLKGALAAADHAIALDPTVTRMYAWRGSLKHELGDYRGAIIDLDRALGADEHVRSFDEAFALGHRGGAKQALGDLAGAVRDYDALLRLRPVLDFTYFYRGNAHSLAREYAKAEADYDYCIAHKPEWPEPYENRGLLRLWRADLEGALADYSMAVKLAPAMTSAYEGRARVYLLRGERALARAEMDRAVALKPEAASFAKRARFEVLAGDFTGALADYERALDDGQPYTRFFHWLTARRLGRIDAEGTLRRLLPEWAEGWPKSIGSYLTGQLNETEFLARAATGDARGQSGQLCEAYYYIGMARWLAGEKVIAEDYFRRCVGTKLVNYLEFDFAQTELSRLTVR